MARGVSAPRPPLRGDLYWVVLDPVIGSEIRKTRPAIIVSNNAMNRAGTRVIVVPVTSRITGELYPGEVPLRAGGKNARALSDQIRAIDRRRLRNRIGRIAPADMTALGDALGLSLALPH